MSLFRELNNCLCCLFKTEILLECAKCAIANWHTNVGRLVTSRAMLKN